VKGSLRNARVISLTAVLVLGAAILLLQEQRASFLRPGLRLNAYVSTADGNVTVVDLVKLRAEAKILVGPGISGMREHPARAEVWGVSSLAGYVWVLNTRVNQITTRIPVGALPYAIDFSPDGSRLFTTASGSDTLVAIDCQSHAIVARARTGHEPVLARGTPDGKSVLVVNRRDASLGIHDAVTLSETGTIPVVAQPEDVLVMADGSVAFVLSRTEPRLSLVDLQRRVLLTNLELAGRPSQMLLKPDGGELYVISPEAHGLQVINTWTHEVGDYVMLGSAPTHGLLMPDASQLFVSDSAAGRVAPLDIYNRRVGPPISAGQGPAALRFDSSDPDAKPSLLMVVNQGSGDLAVIRVRGDKQSLVTLISVGQQPQELAVKLF
jgi:YVTN family beta-propeller protein